MLVPDTVEKARFLTPRQKYALRLRQNNLAASVGALAAADGTKSLSRTMAAAVEAVRDVKTYLWGTMIFFISANSNSIAVFGPLILKSFVDDSSKTMLLNIPFGLAMFGAITLSAAVAQRLQLNSLIIVVASCIALVGTGILRAVGHDLTRRGILLFGYYLLSVYPAIRKLPSNPMRTRLPN